MLSARAPARRGDRRAARQICSHRHVLILSREPGRPSPPGNPARSAGRARRGSPPWPCSRHPRPEAKTERNHRGPGNRGGGRGRRRQLQLLQNPLGDRLGDQIDLVAVLHLGILVGESLDDRPGLRVDDPHVQAELPVVVDEIPHDHVAVPRPSSRSCAAVAASMRAVLPSSWLEIAPAVALRGAALPPGLRLSSLARICAMPPPSALEALLVEPE